MTQLCIRMKLLTFHPLSKNVFVGLKTTVFLRFCLVFESFKYCEITCLNYSRQKMATNKTRSRADSRIDFRIRLQAQQDSSLGNIISWLNSKDRIVANLLVSKALLMAYLPEAHSANPQLAREKYQECLHLWSEHLFVVRDALDIHLSEISHSNPSLHQNVPEHIPPTEDDDDDDEDDDESEIERQSIFFNDDEFD